MTDKLPERIWMQRCEEGCCFDTWCVDRINGDDVEFVRAPAAPDGPTLTEDERAAVIDATVRECARILFDRANDIERAGVPLADAAKDLRIMATEMYRPELADRALRRLSSGQPGGAGTREATDG